MTPTISLLFIITRSNDLDNPSAQTNDDGHAGATSSSAKPDNNVELASSRVHDKSKIALSEVERAGYQYGTSVNVGLHCWLAE